MASAVFQLLLGDESTQLPAVGGDATVTLGADLGGGTIIINANADPSDVQSDFEDVPAIGSGNIDVEAILDNDSEIIGYQFTFQGDLSNRAIDALSVSSSLSQSADTILCITIVPGIADGPGAVTPTLTTIQPADGSSQYQIDEITFSSHPVSGTMTLTYYGVVSQTFDSTIHTSADIQAWINSAVIVGATVTGDWSSVFVITYTDGGFFSSYPGAISSSSLLNSGSGGQGQIVSVSLTDSPTSGTLVVTLGGVQSAEFNYNDSGPGAISGWGGTGAAGNWDYVADTDFDSVAASGSPVQPLTKALGAVVVTVTAGSGGAGATARATFGLQMGMGF